MDSKLEVEVRAAHAEISGVVAALLLEDAKHSVVSREGVRSRSAAVMNPAGFWAGAVMGETGDLQTVEAGIKLAAAKLMAGDISFVIESSLGQIAWLSVLALQLTEDANKMPVYSRGKHVTLALRAQSAAAKLGLSLGGLIKLGAGGGPAWVEEGNE